MLVGRRGRVVLGATVCGAEPQIFSLDGWCAAVAIVNLWIRYAYLSQHLSTHIYIYLGGWLTGGSTVLVRGAERADRVDSTRGLRLGWCARVL